MTAQTPVCRGFPLWFLVYLKAEHNIKIVHQPHTGFQSVGRFDGGGTDPLRLAGSEWYACFPCSAMEGAWCVSLWLWLACSGWTWLFRSTWLVGRDMCCFPFSTTSAALGSGLSRPRCLRFFVGEDTSMTLMSGMLVCLRGSSVWASFSFFMWLMATAAL